MLGTALQLIGWRSFESSNGADLLPIHLRTVGDAVFINDVRHAIKLVIGQDAASVSADTSCRSSQLTLAKYLSLRRSPDPPADVREELEAGLKLIERLRSRRYYRPIFRALPSLQDKNLKVNAKLIAEKLRHPDVRFQVEREIEKVAKLKLGSVVIHCPRQTTAEKIANALLYLPGEAGGDDKLCRLHDISCLVRKIFKKHQQAIKAVEKMYRSMWRLLVYVAPEYVPRHSEIAKVIGQVLFEAVGSQDARTVHPDGALRNDPMLERELTTREREMKWRTAHSRPTYAAEQDVSVFGAALREFAAGRGLELARDADALKLQLESIFIGQEVMTSTIVTTKAPEGLFGDNHLPNEARFLDALARQLGVKKFTAEQRKKFTEFFQEFLFVKEQQAFDQYLSAMEGSLIVVAGDRNRPFNTSMVLGRLKDLLDGDLPKESNRQGS